MKCAMMISALLCLGACNFVSPQDEVRPSIAPSEFALTPCAEPLAEKPCALAIAGGKRVLFGAPAGVAASLTPEDLRGLDAVMLFSLRAGDIEGLDEVRNESWRAGRSVPLRVVGPEGTVQVVEALNKMFEQADALRVVEEGIPRGGYDAAVLEGVELPVGASDATVFDTGDVRVQVFGAHYVVSYRDREQNTYLARLTGCGDGAPYDASLSEYTRLINVSCLEDANIKWPLTKTVFVTK